MGQLFFIELLIILSLAFGRTEGPELFEGAHQPPTCKECHSDLVEYELMHYPAEDACDNCHEPTGASHPSDDSLGFRLMDNIPELCYYCHEEPAQFAFPHQVHASGDCLACHDAHGSDRSSLILLADPDLCLSCHKRHYKTDSSETVNIKRLITGKMKAHSAIEGGGCLSCHLSHGSGKRALLVETYPEADYLPALTGNFALCFMCHDTDLMEAEETEWGTGFRNGTRNLHWLHMNGNKGRNCRMCHNIHGSPLPFLLEEKLAFGSWEMRMNFIPEEQGGSCFPGCHGKLSYQR
jgi:predicted CXXCH cytochrome family protein